jgi:hypothetical protein
LSRTSGSPRWGMGWKSRQNAWASGNRTGANPVTHPERGLLAGARGAVRVVGGEALLGQDVQPGEEAEGLVEVEIGDMTTSLLIEQLQGQQAEQRRGSRDHLGAGIARLRDQGIEPESGEQGQEEEGPRHPSAEPPPRSQSQLAPIGDLRWVRLRRCAMAPLVAGSSIRRGGKKGGNWPVRH